GTAAERLAHRNEFRAPGCGRAEISRQACPKGRSCLALLAQAVEEQLMEDHRVHRDELLALEPVDQESRSARGVEPGELLLDQIEALHRPAIVVLIVADDQPFRHSADPARIAGEGLHLEGHRWLSIVRAPRSERRLAAPLMLVPWLASCGFRLASCG